jgi:Flp pilus assembly protein TadD
LRSAARIDFDNELAVSNLLAAARQAGQREDALWALLILARLRPEDVKVRNELASELLTHGRASEALSQAAFAAWLDPRSAEAYCHLGMALESLGQKEQAAAVFHRALEIDPTSKAANAALTLRRKGP